MAIPVKSTPDVAPSPKAPVAAPKPAAAAPVAAPKPAQPTIKGDAKQVKTDTHAEAHDVNLDHALDKAVSAIDSKPAAGGTYTVKPGDSLSKIAKHLAKDPQKWKELLALNPQIKNPDLIYPGQKLTLPASWGQAAEQMGPAKPGAPAAKAPTQPLPAIKPQAAIPPKPQPTPTTGREATGPGGAPLPVPPPKPQAQAPITQEAAIDKELFDSLDRNSDDQLLPTEQGTVQGVKIAQYDTDKNGLVSREEFMRGRAAERAAKKMTPADEEALKYDERQFSRLDYNSDGVLVDGRALKQNIRFDANKDGKITREEFLAGRAAERKAKGISLETLRQSDADEAEFDKLDLSGDGLINNDGGKPYRDNARYDTNHDNAIDREEFVKGRAADRK